VELGDSKIIVVAVGDFQETEMEHLLQYIYLGTLAVNPHDFKMFSKLAQKLFVPLHLDSIIPKNLQPAVITIMICSD